MCVYAVLVTQMHGPRGLERVIISIVSMYDCNVPAASIMRKQQNYVINVAGHLPACCEIQIIYEFGVA